MVSPPARERFDEARLINIANGLTAARVLLVPYFAFLLISGRGKTALLVFAVCGATDVLDGLLARWLRQRTLVGTLLDPIADKLLMATAFIVLSYVHIVPLRLTDHGDQQGHHHPRGELPLPPPVRMRATSGRRDSARRTRRSRS